MTSLSLHLLQSAGVGLECVEGAHRILKDIHDATAGSQRLHAISTPQTPTHGAKHQLRSSRTFHVYIKSRFMTRITCAESKFRG